MEKLKLISVRVDPNVLPRLDAFTRLHPYWSRSAVINAVLVHCCCHLSFDELYDIVSSELTRADYTIKKIF